VAEETFNHQGGVNRIRRIAVTGPESTGKSRLAGQLAEYFHTSWIPEYAREYIDGLDRPYDETDILEIARGQMEREERQASASKGLLFCDTELIVTKIWSEVKYGRCHPWILEQIEKHPYDLYLLCYIDIPWEADPQREHPHMRERLFTLYYEELLERNFPFEVIKGLDGERLQNAVRQIRKNFDI
jgi:NadR type nicotinamide-nucleotide adenylyltransferase